MSIGILKIVSNGDVSFAPIKTLFNEREEFGTLKYSLGVAESFDIDLNSPIDSIEIEYLNTEWEYSTHVEVMCKYMDYNINAVVIDFE